MPGFTMLPGKTSPLEQGSQHSLKEMAGEGLEIASEEAVQVVEFPKTFTFERLEAAPLFMTGCCLSLSAGGSSVLDVEIVAQCGNCCRAWCGLRHKQQGRKQQNATGASSSTGTSRY
jgi:hypothetical protein